MANSQHHNHQITVNDHSYCEMSQPLQKCCASLTFFSRVHHSFYASSCQLVSTIITKTAADVWFFSVLSSALAVCAIMLRLFMTKTSCVLQIFTLFLIHAYSSRVWKQQDDEEDNSNIGTAAIEHGFQSPKGHSKLVMDGPLRLLWPCLLLWPCMQAIASYEFITSAIGETHPTFILADSRTICK